MRGISSKRFQFCLEHNEDALIMSVMYISKLEEGDTVEFEISSEYVTDLFVLTSTMTTAVS